MIALFFFFAACMAAVGGFACLLVAAIEFGALGTPRPGSWLSVADSMTFGVISVARGIVQHWTTVSALRRLVYAGCGALVWATMCAGIALTTVR